MKLKAIGSNVLLTRVRPTDKLVSGIDLDNSDGLFIWKVTSVGEEVTTVKEGDEVAILGEVVPFDPVMYGDGMTKNWLCNVKQIACVVNGRADWVRPNIIVAPPMRVLGGKERQAMHAGAAKAEMVS